MLNSTQLATVKADILANPTLSAYWDNKNPAAIAAAYNVQTTPSFYVWKTSVSPEEYIEATVWTEVDALTVGKARIWEWVTKGQTAALNPSKANIRQGLADCWASNTTTRTNLLTAGKRLANNIEKLLASGTGTEGTPATMTFEGQIQWSDINAAMEA
jgi:hypothetical protein